MGVYIGSKQYGKVVVQSEITQGTDTSDATLNSNDQLPSGVTAYADGDKYIGTQPVDPDVTVNGRVVNVPKGFYSTHQQIFVPDSGITPSGTITITSNGTGINVAQYELADVNVSGGGSGGTYQTKTNISPTTSSQTITPDSGYDALSSVQINAMPSGTAGTPTATKGTVSNHSVSVTPSVTNTTGYITGSTKTGTAVTVSASELVSGTKSISANGTGIDVTEYASVDVAVPTGSTPTLQSKTVSPTESQQTVTPDSGYDGLDEVTVGAISSTYVGSDVPRRTNLDVEVNANYFVAPEGYYPEEFGGTISQGSATTPATTITANPSISVNASGLITATASATQSITPTVSSGYVSTGTAGTITVSGSNTSQLTTQAAKTVTPTESEQTAVASGVYTTGVVKVGAISSTYVGSGIARKSSSDVDIDGPVVAFPAGYYASSHAGVMGAATVTLPSSITETGAALVSTGTNLITIGKNNVSYAPTVSQAGYISSISAQNMSVTLTANLTTQAAQTLYPSTTDQTIAANQFLTGAQTIKAVTVSGLSAANIASGVTVKIGDSVDDDRITSVTGTLAFQTIYSGSSAPSSSQGVNGDVYVQTS